MGEKYSDGRITRSGRRITEHHREITLHGENRKLTLDLFDDERPIHVEGMLEQRKGKPHVKGVTLALYIAARKILENLARKKDASVHYTMRTKYPRVKWFFQHGPGKDVLPWDHEEETSRGELIKYAKIRNKHSG